MQPGADADRHAAGSRRAGSSIARKAAGRTVPSGPCTNAMLVLLISRPSRTVGRIDCRLHGKPPPRPPYALCPGRVAALTCGARGRLSGTMVATGAVCCVRGGGGRKGQKGAEGRARKQTTHNTAHSTQHHSTTAPHHHSTTCSAADTGIVRQRFAVTARPARRHPGISSLKPATIMCQTLAVSSRMYRSLSLLRAHT